MTLYESSLLLFMAPFLLLSGAVFASLAMTFILNFLRFGWLLGNILWEASVHAATEVFNWRKR